MFDKIKYPDGQISAKVTDFPLHITARINSYEDLIYIRSLAEVYHHNNKEVTLFIPCLFGQRSDKRFSEKQSFDLKIIAEIINACDFKSITIFDPHSDVCLGMIDNAISMPSLPYVQAAIKLIKEQLPEDQELVLVAPDAGAFKKVFMYGQATGLPVIGTNKYRDKDGNITISFSHSMDNKWALIVDDLCDGGYTFELLGKELRKYSCNKVFLYVSHGLFSKGFVELPKVIDHIYCTNSVKEIPSDTPVYGHQKLSDFLTQFKII